MSESTRIFPSECESCWVALSRWDGTWGRGFLSARCGASSCGASGTSARRGFDSSVSRDFVVISHGAHAATGSSTPLLNGYLASAWGQTSTLSSTASPSISITSPL